MKDNSSLRPQFGGALSLSPTHSSNDFLNWLETKHRQEIEKLQTLLSPPPTKSIPFPNCLPQFNRHRWTAFGVSLPQGKIYQCQFCFHEKLVPPNSPNLKERVFAFYYPPQTYYIR